MKQQLNSFLQLGGTPKEQTDRYEIKSHQINNNNLFIFSLSYRSFLEQLLHSNNESDIIEGLKIFVEASKYDFNHI